MNTEKQEVRNIKGTMLCEIAFVKGHWYIAMLDHKCYTMIELAPNGAAKITNYDPGVKP